MVTISGTGQRFSTPFSVTAFSRRNRLGHAETRVRRFPDQRRRTHRFRAHLRRPTRNGTGRQRPYRVRILGRSRDRLGDDVAALARPTAEAALELVKKAPIGAGRWADPVLWHYGQVVAEFRRGGR
jgi:hypothetical protein